MLPTVWTDRPWQIFLQAIGKQRDFWFLWLNGLTRLLLGTLSVYAKVKHKGWEIKFMFTDTFYHPYSGILTCVSEILWCLPVTVCAFSFFSISKGKPRRYTKRFMIASGVSIAAGRSLPTGP
ncbi:MAG: hypothetical protein AB4352_07220 [Hormoscilla sp.]